MEKSYKMQQIYFIFDYLNQKTNLGGNMKTKIINQSCKKTRLCTIQALKLKISNKSVKITVQSGFFLKMNKRAGFYNRVGGNFSQK